MCEVENIKMTKIDISAIILVQYFCTYRNYLSASFAAIQHALVFSRADWHLNFAYYAAIE